MINVRFTCEQSASCAGTTTNLCHSHISMAERLNCRSVMEDTVHRTLPRVRLPGLQQIQGEMGQRGIELCFCLPQVPALRSSSNRMRTDYIQTDSLSLPPPATWLAKSSTHPCTSSLASWTWRTSCSAPPIGSSWTARPMLSIERG